MKLAHYQLEQIEDYIKDQNIWYDDVRQELLDHVATAVEEKMENEDFSFVDACGEIFTTIDIPKFQRHKLKYEHIATLKEVGNEMLTFFQGAKLLCLVAIISASAVALAQPALTKEWFWTLTVWSPALLLFYFIIVPIYARKYRVLYLSYYMSRVNALYTPTFLIISLLGYLDAWFLQNTSIALVVFSIFYLFVISALSVLHKTLKKVKSNVAYS
ncbi:hypothetical protein [Roseivirga sp.]|uniref:hypothetical protein n=1 Tax=Roseivirga sp. TaxID=1964215 RepID=UPI003B8C30B5